MRYVLNAISDELDKLVDASKLKISTHALAQYNVKCYPNLSLIEVSNQMRENMKRLKKIDCISEKEKYKNRIYYLGSDNVIYVTANNTVITTFLKDRIFKPKPMYINKKAGFKWL